MLQGVGVVGRGIAGNTPELWAFDIWSFVWLRLLLFALMIPSATPKSMSSFHGNSSHRPFFMLAI